MQYYLSLQVLSIGFAGKIKPNDNKATKEQANFNTYMSTHATWVMNILRGKIPAEIVYSFNNSWFWYLQFDVIEELVAIRTGMSNCTYFRGTLFLHNMYSKSFCTGFRSYQWSEEEAEFVRLWVDFHYKNLFEVKTEQSSSENYALVLRPGVRSSLRSFLPYFLSLSPVSVSHISLICPAHSHTHTHSGESVHVFMCVHVCEREREEPFAPRRLLASLFILGVRTAGQKVWENAAQVGEKERKKKEKTFSLLGLPLDRLTQSTFNRLERHTPSKRPLFPTFPPSPWIKTQTKNFVD